MKEYTPVTEQEDFIGKAVVNAAFRVHKALGPGLLERVYEVCMEYELKKVVRTEIEETNNIIYQLEMLKCCRIVINKDFNI